MGRGAHGPSFLGQFSNLEMRLFMLLDDEIVPAIRVLVLKTRSKTNARNNAS